MPDRLETDVLSFGNQICLRTRTQLKDDAEETLKYLNQTEIPNIDEPRHDKTNKMACAPSEDLDQPGHPPSLISLRCQHEESLGP